MWSFDCVTCQYRCFISQVNDSLAYSGAKGSHKVWKSSSWFCVRDGWVLVIVLPWLLSCDCWICNVTALLQTKCNVMSNESSGFNTGFQLSTLQFTGVLEPVHYFFKYFYGMHTYLMRYLHKCMKIWWTRREVLSVSMYRLLHYSRWFMSHSEPCTFPGPLWVAEVPTKSSWLLKIGWENLPSTVHANHQLLCSLSPSSSHNLLNAF